MKRSCFTIAVILIAKAISSGQSLPTWHPIWTESSSSVNCLSETKRAELLLKAEKDDVNAQDVLGTEYLADCGGKHDPVKGVQLLERAATKGNVHAQVTLGKAYLAGNGTPKDVSKAVSWFQKAAEKGNPQAQNSLGVRYQSGEGVIKDPERAVQLFRSAAEHDLPEAESNLAVCFDQGFGVTQNYQLARTWYMKVAKRDHSAAAEYRLGMLYEMGLGGDKNLDTAMQWYKKAAEDGSEDAQVRTGQKSPSQARSIDSGYFQYTIAQQMLTGDGIAKDEAKGVMFMQKAAEAGYPPAMVDLAIIFSEGRVAKKDEPKALEYCRSAIERDEKYHAGYNTFAWILLTADDLNLRNPQKALEYATKAVALSNGKDAADLDTLAHAYFQTGEIEKALETETKAAALAPKNDFIQKTLLEYKSAQKPQ